MAIMMMVFNNLLLSLAVQCIYGLSDPASAREAEDQTDAPSGR